MINEKQFIYRVAYQLKRIKTKRNDVIKMQIITFKNAFDVIEMFESRFSYANVEMSQIVRDDVETYLSRIDALTFDFDEMHRKIETSLQYQIAMKYCEINFDVENNNYHINMISQYIDANQFRSLFELIHVDSMNRVATFVIDEKMRIIVIRES